MKNIQQELPEFCRSLRINGFNGLEFEFVRHCPLNKGEYFVGPDGDISQEEWEKWQSNYGYFYAKFKEPNHGEYGRFFGERNATADFLEHCKEFFGADVRLVDPYKYEFEVERI